MLFCPQLCDYLEASMQSNFPTVEIYFAFALSYCKLRVYKKQEAFARRILETQEVEFLASSASKDWYEIDTRVLLDLVGQALPGLISKALPQPDEVTAKIKGALGIKQ